MRPVASFNSGVSARALIRGDWSGVSHWGPATPLPHPYVHPQGMNLILRHDVLVVSYDVAVFLVVFCLLNDIVRIGSDLLVDSQVMVEQQSRGGKTIWSLGEMQVRGKTHISTGSTARARRAFRPHVEVAVEEEGYEALCTHRVKKAAL